MKNIISLNKGWTFKKNLPNFLEGNDQIVDVPHNWNSLDGQDGGNDYFRGECEYSKVLPSTAIADDEVAFVEFKAVNASCNVFVNDELLKHHDGGYSAFKVAVDKKYFDGKSMLRVVVNNNVNEDVYPQRADFTFYGGIYRDVNLIITNKNHFDIEKDGGIGVQIDVFMKENDGVVEVEPWIVGEGTTQMTLFDAEGKQVAKTTEKHMEIANPHLWNGLKDPYMYMLKVELLNNDKVVDSVEKTVGFRSFKVDSKKGFYLNGVSYPLRGVCRHQDRRGIGNSLTKEMHDEDMEMVREIGANTLRLAHYQHDDYFYDLCDKNGIVVWAEIPYISKHLDNGNANLDTQMTELIQQSRHHPSICFWGISNEITMFKGYTKQSLEANKHLNDLTHELDQHRLTTMACFSMCGPFNKISTITDVVSWNLYFGWYTPFKWLNYAWFWFAHLFSPKKCLGLSEYGAEAMTNLHTNHPHRGDSTEEYQLLYHNYMLEFFAKKPYIWGTHVWNMFDFGSDGRNHGGEPGINHKGLVTFDHKTKKDSFYIYKAYWNEEKFCHICGKRFQKRNGNSTTIYVISNEDKITVNVNGKLFKNLEGKKIYKLNVKLTENIKMEVKGASSSDEFEFIKVEKFPDEYKLMAKSNNYSWEK